MPSSHGRRTRHERDERSASLGDEQSFSISMRPRSRSPPPKRSGGSGGARRSRSQTPSSGVSRSHSRSMSGSRTPVSESESGPRERKPVRRTTASPKRNSGGGGGAGTRSASGAPRSGGRLGSKRDAAYHKKRPASSKKPSKSGGPRERRVHGKTHLHGKTSRGFGVSIRRLQADIHNGHHASLSENAVQQLSGMAIDLIKRTAAAAGSLLTKTKTVKADTVKTALKLSLPDNADLLSKTLSVGVAPALKKYTASDAGSKGNPVRLETRAGLQISVSRVKSHFRPALPYGVNVSQGADVAMAAAVDFVLGEVLEQVNALIHQRRNRIKSTRRPATTRGKRADVQRVINHDPDLRSLFGNAAIGSHLGVLTVQPAAHKKKKRSTKGKGKKKPSTKGGKKKRGKAKK